MQACRPLGLDETTLIANLTSGSSSYESVVLEHRWDELLQLQTIGCYFNWRRADRSQLHNYGKDLRAVWSLLGNLCPFLVRHEN